MTHAPWLGMIALFLMSGLAFGATYPVQTNQKGENVLDRAVAPGGSHEGMPKNQVLQRFVNSGLTSLHDQQSSADSRQLEEKLKVATPAAQNQAEQVLNAGITPPVVADIPNQTNNVAQSPVIPIIATDVDNLSLRIEAQGLPPGMAISFDTAGAPQITGTLTTAGTYNVTVRAIKLGDIPGTDTFTWTVNP